MASLAPQPRMRFTDELGNPLSGGKVYTYLAGTSTPAPTYTDQSGNTPNPNPITLDQDGGYSIWWEGAYKIDVKKVVNGTETSLTGYPVDNVNIYDMIDWSDLTATIADLNATDTSTISKTTNYPIVLSDRGKTILCDATSASFTITLLPAATATNGYQITIKKTDVSTNTITIDGNGSETIEGRTTFLLYDQNDVVTILCDGSNWRVKSGVIRGNTELKSDAFTTTISDINKTFLCSATAAYAVTLLSAATAGDGFRLRFKKLDDLNAITLTPAGMETIDGLSSYILSDDYQSVTILSNGEDWYVEDTTQLHSGLTGQIIFVVDSTAPPGWLPLDGGTIGNASSGGTTRANADCQNLFTKLWNNISNTWCIVSGGRGASAAADFAANKTIRLPFPPGTAIGNAGTGTLNLIFTAASDTDLLTLGSTQSLFTGTAFQLSTTGTLPSPLATATTYYAIRESATTIKVASSHANAVAGTAIDLTNDGTGTHTLTINFTSRADGEVVGEEGHTDLTSEMPSHHHEYVYTNSANQANTGGDNFQVNPSESNTPTSNTGGDEPHNNMQPTTFIHAYIKL